MIEIEATYTYPTGIKLRFEFRAREGEKVFISGRTGCGKSTLLRILNGLIPDLYGGKLEGKVRVFGRAGNNRDVFLVTQHPEEQIVCERVIEEVAFSLVQRGWEWKDARNYAEEVLASFGVENLAKRRTSELSDGEKQAVIVCSALATNCLCLAFDEPFSHLHPKLAKKIVKKILKDNRTVILSEHRIELSEGFKIFEIEPCPDTAKLEVESGEYGKTLITAKNANVYRGKKLILKGINFKIKEGESLALTGVNGSGKTTLLRALAGLERSRGIEIRGKVRMAFQYPGYTLNSNIVRNEVSMDMLRKFKLDRLSDRHPHSLSGGEKRILSALKAFGGKIVLLDEPTAGLDKNLRQTLISKFVHLARIEKKALVIATHDEDVADMCDRRLELENHAE
ncbi:MAG: ribose ABC transporter ATP-binding protein [Archaeoglobus sp.]|nr:MAG: ribose ABC transporter ATP-binding protein [Archaeoglobus sp.]